MWYTLVQLQSFKRDWRTLKLTDEDLQALEILLLKNPQGGDVLQGSGGLRKLRFAPPSMHTGKSGGTRVVFIFMAEGPAIFLFSVFSKNAKANLTAAEKKLCRKVLNDLRKELLDRKEK